MANLGTIGVSSHAAHAVKLAHTAGAPAGQRGMPVRYVRRATILVPWRTLQYGGGVSLISKT